MDDLSQAIIAIECHLAGREDSLLNAWTTICAALDDRQQHSANREDDSCDWEYDRDYDYWSTGCGEEFILGSGTQHENDIHFCPYCGRKVKEGADETSR